MPSDICSNISNWQLVTLLAIQFSFNLCSFGTFSIQSTCEIDLCILVTRPDLTVTLARNDKDLATVLYKCLELSPSAPPLQRFATPCGLLKGSRIFHDWVKVQLGWPIHQQRSYSSLGTAPAGDAHAQSKNNLLFSPPANLLTWFPFYPPVPPFCRLFEVKLAVAYIQTTLVSARSKGLKVNRKRGYSLITYHISISDTHSSPIIYLYTSIDLTFGLLNVEGIHQSPPIAMLHPFSKHLLKAVRMINNNKDGCAITSCRERGCSGWSWEAEIQDCDLRPPKYMWTSLQPVGIKRHILWRLEI